MKVKLIYSHFDEESGISTAIINTDYGQFKGTSKLHEEDKNISSHFAGCQYAETKAILSYMKKRIEVIKYEIKSLEKCQKVLMGKKDYNHNSSENRTVRKQIYLLKKSKKMWEDRAESLHNKLLSLMEKREKMVINNLKGEEKAND